MATTKAEETHSALTNLVERGMRLSDAVRQLAQETGRSEAAIRANYYNQRAKLGISGGQRGRPRRAGLTVDDAVREARQLLEQALQAIDDELAKAEREATAAAERHEALKAETAERKAELKRKIAALADDAPPKRERRTIRP
jgi:hypothetical protein